MSIVERAVGRLAGGPTGNVSAKRAQLAQPVQSAQFVDPPVPGRAATVDAAIASAEREEPRLEIDARVLRSRHFITPQSGRTMIAEDFRRIKRHLLAGSPKPRVMVTSALPGEGKTFCAINLAISLAMELDRRVLLVDADTVRPNVLQSLGVENTLPGLMDALVEGHPRVGDDMIRRTNIGKLSILPPGTHRDNATELLASDLMRTLVAELSARHPDQIVIFDSPPLLVASESAALASHMSQILLVVAANQTSEVALKEALKRLDERDCPVGLLLNKNESAGAGYGYYGYGQGYGAGS